MVVFGRGQRNNIGKQATRDRRLDGLFPRLRRCREQPGHEMPGEPFAHQGVAKAPSISETRTAQAMMDFVRDLPTQISVAERTDEIKIIRVERERKQTWSVAVPNHADLGNDPTGNALDQDVQPRRRNQARHDGLGRLNFGRDPATPRTQPAFRLKPVQCPFWLGGVDHRSPSNNGARVSANSSTALMRWSPSAASSAIDNAIIPRLANQMPRAVRSK